MRPADIAKPTKRAKVLVVDDDDDFRGLIRRIFQDDSYRVTDAVSARQAWRLLLEESFDIVILDLVLRKETDGMTLLKRLRQEPRIKDIPVVTVTCHLGDEWLARSIKKGATDCFRKGFDPRIFKSKIDQFISQRRDEGEKGREPRVKGVVLLASDDTKRLILTRQWLKADGYRVISTSNPARVATLARKRRPDCIVLDCDRGGCRAAEICADIQPHTLIRPTPVVVRSRHRAKKLDILKAGADHFVQESNNPDELLVIIHVCLRRKEWNVQILRKGDLMLDPQGRTVYLKDVPVAVLSEEQFRFLYLLVRNSPKPVSRREIFRRVMRCPEPPAKSRAVDGLAYRLRKELGEPVSAGVVSSRNFGFVYLPEIHE